MKFSLVWIVNPLNRSFSITDVTDRRTWRRDSNIRSAFQILSWKPIASTKKESVIAPFQLPQPLCSINESPLKSLPLRLNNSNILFSSMNRVQINDKFQQISRFSSTIHVLSSSMKILSFSFWHILVKKRNFNILVRFEFLESV